MNPVSLTVSDPSHTGNESIYSIRTLRPGPGGALPLTDDMLRNWASGDLFGLTQDAGMGWDPTQLGRKEFLILSTSGGLRADDGSPIALGYHTGHWEVALWRGRRRGGLRNGAASRLPGPSPILAMDGPRARGDDGQPALSKRCGDRPAPAYSIAPHAAPASWESEPATRDCPP